MMKKISTGERVNIQDIRRGIDQLHLPDSEAEIAGEQLFVEELMDTTPSSSFGEDAWRDGYIYDRYSISHHHAIHKLVCASMCI
jgi:hypothetical protein